MKRLSTSLDTLVSGSKKATWTRRELFLRASGSNLTVENGNVRISLRPTFNSIFENRSHVGVGTISARTSKNVVIKGKTPAFADVHPIWLRWLDVFGTVNWKAIEQEMKWLSASMPQLALSQ